MALNSVSVVGPRSEPQKQEKPKRDWVENVINGLQIVKGVTGIAVDYQTIQKHMEDRDAQEFSQTGGLTGPQIASAQASGLQEVAVNEPNSTTYRRQQPNGDVSEFGLRKVVKEATPVTPLVEATTRGPDGKPVTTLVKKAEGASWTPYEKPIDQNGNTEFGDTSSLRKEYDAHPVTKASSQLATSFNKIEKSAASKSPNGATDISLVFNFMKMNDPTSSVREGEQADARNSGGVIDSLRNTYNKVLSGQRLSPEQRAAFASEAKSLLSTQLDLQKQQDDRFGSLAIGRKLKPNEVVDPTFERLRQKLKESDLETSGQSDSGTAQAAPFTPRREKSPKDGKWYSEIGPDQWVLDTNQGG